MSRAAARFGLLDRMNLTTIREAIPGSNGDPATINDAAVIRFALHVVATVIAAGDLDRFRPGYRTPPDAVSTPN